MRRDEGLDGVRGFATALILLFHGFYGTMCPLYGPPRVYTGVAAALVALTRPLSGGVDVFFVLSGFLISRSLLSRPRLHWRDVKLFYLRRFARLYPLYLALLLVLIALVSTPAFLAWSAVFLGNACDLWGVPIAWLPLWSVAVEVHFYLLWPLLLLAFGRRGWVAASALLVVLTPALRAWGEGHGANVYAHTWFRLDALAFGSWMAASPEGRRGRAYGCVALFIGLVALAPDVLSHESVAGRIWAGDVWMILGAGLVCGALVQTAGFGWLRWQWLQLLGRWSYGIFLIHPVAYFLCARWAPTEASVLLVGSRAVLVSLASVALAKLSFERLEEPARMALLRYE